MIRFGLAAVTLALISSCTTWTPFDQKQIDLASQRASTAADLLFRRLSGELSAAMASGGPAAAILVCKERAPELADEIGATTSIDIERTALRVRNAANAPDEWETETMQAFIARRQGGEQWQGMTAVRIEGAQLRWMRPIPLGPMCAACHGEDTQIAQDTRRALLDAYPQDEAVGFRSDELRGAFTARVSLKSTR
jgi:hypothetical protein